MPPAPSAPRTVRVGWGLGRGRTPPGVRVVPFRGRGVAAPTATLVSVSTPALAGPCDQVGGVVTGDWTISNVQVCSGILYTVDGSITINSGGGLTLIDGGLRVA